ncbi:protein of unknown function [Rhodovastum atsumiense]|nr:protein of unknown function [Rhodovastum atsumiense]
MSRCACRMTEGIPRVASTSRSHATCSCTRAWSSRIKVASQALSLWLKRRPRSPKRAARYGKRSQQPSTACCDAASSRGSDTTAWEPASALSMVAENIRGLGRSSGAPDHLYSLSAAAARGNTGFSRNVNIAPEFDLINSILADIYLCLGIYYF